MRRLLVLFLISTFALPASAHKLKVFANVDGESVAGFAFFVGGGRPIGSTFIIRNAEGDELYRGQTNEQGEFTWTPAKPGDLTIIVDAGDGHVAQTTLVRSRFPSTPSGSTSSLSVSSDAARAVAVVPDGAPPASTYSGNMTCSPEDIETLVGEAVARQVQPLLIAYAENQERARFTDVVGGIGMIIGMAGMALWILSRRRKPNSDER